MSKKAYLHGFSDSKVWHDIIKYVIPNCEVSRYLSESGWTLLVDGPNLADYVRSTGMHIEVYDEDIHSIDLIVSTHPANLRQAINIAKEFSDIPSVCVDGDCHIRNHKRYGDELEYIDVFISRTPATPDYSNMESLLFSRIENRPCVEKCPEGLSVVGHLKKHDQSHNYLTRKLMYEFINDTIEDANFYGQIELDEVDSNKSVDLRSINLGTSILDMRTVYIKHGYVTPKFLELLNSSDVLLLPSGHEVLDSLYYPRSLYYDPDDLSSIISAYEASKLYDNTTKNLKYQIDEYISKHNVEEILTRRLPELF